MFNPVKLLRPLKSSFEKSERENSNSIFWPSSPSVSVRAFQISIRFPPLILEHLLCEREREVYSFRVTQKKREKERVEEKEMVVGKRGG